MLIFLIPSLGLDKFTFISQISYITAIWLLYNTVYTVKLSSHFKFSDVFYISSKK